MIKIYELIGGLRCVEITATITPTRRIERLEGWIGAHIRNMLLAATNEVECEGYGSLMDRVNHFPIEDSTHPWYKELKGGFPKGYVVKVLSPKQRTYELDIERGEAIKFSITLIGSFSEYASKMIKAIEIFAERGILCPMELTIDAVAQHSMLELLYTPCHSDRIAVDFITPVALVRNKSIASNSLQSKTNGFMSMHQLVIAATNRLSKMAVLYGECKAIPAELRDAAEEIAAIASGVSLQQCNLRRVVLSTLKKRAAKDTMIFDGLVGRTEWSGDIAVLYPLLKFCSYISLGENVVYGMGNFGVD